MFRKIAVLAMAVGAAAAFALPASASASWKHHSTPIAADTTIGLTGNVRFQGGLGGVECQITARSKFLAGQTTGVTETFVPHPTSDTANCKGLGGLAFCQVHNLTPQAPNWTKHPSVTFNNITVTLQLTEGSLTGGFCPVQKIGLTPGTVTFTPNQPNTASSATLSGTLQADLTTSGGTIDKETVTTSGTVTIESPNANTYSL